MRKFLLSIPLLSTLFIASCSSLYMPNVPNTPMFTQGGELHASGHVSVRGNISVNTALAFTDNFALMLNGSAISQDKEKKDFSQKMAEAGIGYFTTFGKENNRIFEVYGGLGTGNSKRVLSELTYDGAVPYESQDITFDKFFVQVNYSSTRKRKLNLFGEKFPLNYGTALRMSYVTMDKVEMTGVNPLKEDNIFLEPIFFTRMRLNENFQLQYTTGSNFGLKNRKYLTAGNSVFTIGAVYNLGGKKLR
ncbi:hypothetical protein [Desertivirga brevis]|uniref:hypothetical protein n=1 Tax=Desertivirga brevis TaxID=2810310 RepID=UPI001A961FF8|nr:hypothetical protein [Pedobacter sp. SYSU D00873]